MAKKEIIEVDLNDFDDDFDDLFSDDDKPLSRIDRAKRIAKGAGSGVLDALTSRSGILHILDRTIPSSYGIDMQVVGDVLNSVDELKTTTAKELASTNESVKSFLRPLVPKIEGKLPKRLRERIKEYVVSEEHHDGAMMERTAEDLFVAEKLGDLFAIQQSREDLREEERKIRDAISEKSDKEDRKKNLLLSDRIRSSLERLVNFQDQITANYQRKSLELGYRQYHVLAKLLEITKDNATTVNDNLVELHTEIAKPDLLKLREHEKTRQLHGKSNDKQSLFSPIRGVADRIRNNATKRVSETVQSLSMALSMSLGGLETAGSVTSMGGESEQEKARLYASQLAPMVGGYLGGKARKAFEKTNLSKRIGLKSGFATENFRNLLEESVRSNEIEYDDNGNEKFNARRSIAKLLHSLVGDETGSTSLRADTLDSLQTSVPYTQQTNRTINEVIPGLLGMIHQSVEGIRTGELGDVPTFDYVKGTFYGDRDNAKRTINRLMLDGGAAYVASNAADLIDSVDTNKELSETERKELSKFLLQQSHDRRLASKDRLTNADTFEGMDPAQAQKYASLFERFYGDQTDPNRELDFSRNYNRLLDNSSFDRGDFQSIANLGGRRYLEEAGLVKDGKINYDSLFEHILAFDKKDVDSDQTAADDFKRQEAQAKHQERVDEAKKLTGFLGIAKDKFKGSKLDTLLNKGRNSINDKVKEATNVVISSEVYATVADKLKHVDPRSLTKADLTEVLAQAQQASSDLTGLASGLSGIDLATAATELEKTLKASKPASRLASFGDDVKKKLNTFKNPFASPKKLFTEEVVSKAQTLAATQTPPITSSKEALALLNKVHDEMVLSNPTLPTGTIEEADATSRVLDAAKAVSATPPTAASFNHPLNDKIASDTDTNNPLTADDPAVDAGSEFVAQEFREVGSNLEERVTSILDALTEKFESDKKREEGPRVGSYEDIVSKRAAKKDPLATNTGRKDTAKESGFSLLNSIMSKIPLLGGLVTSLLGTLGPMLGLGGLAKGAMSMVGGLASGIPNAGGFAAGASKAAGAATTTAKAGGGLLAKLGRSAWGATKFAGKAAVGTAGLGLSLMNPFTAMGKTLGGIGKVAWGAGKLGFTAARIAAPAIISGITTLAPLMVTPVGLAIGGAALAGYGLYKFFSRVKLTELNRIRLTQYGYDPENLDQLKRIMALESELKTAIKIKPNGIPDIDPQGIDVEALLDALEINKEDKAAIERFNTWIGERFLPIYLIHVGVLNKLSKSADLAKIDDIKKEDLVEYVKAVRIPEGNYSGGFDPKSGDPLPATAETVEVVWTKALEYANKVIPKGTKAAAAAAASVATATAATGAMSKSTSDEVKDAAKAQDASTGSFWSKLGGVARKALNFTPFGALIGLQERAVAGVKDLVSGKVDNAKATLSEIQALEAIRLKLYGLHEMDALKVKTLMDLERLMSNGVDFDADGQATWEGDLSLITFEMAGKFGMVPDTEEAQRLTEWLGKRFLPVYTKALSFVYTRNKSTTLAQGLMRLKSVDRLEMANEIASTTTIVDGQTVSVWLYSGSPWPNYEVNTNPESIKPNLRLLESDASSVILPEKQLGTSTTNSSAPGAMSVPGNNVPLDSYRTTVDKPGDLNLAGMGNVGIGGSYGATGSGQWSSEGAEVSFEMGTGGAADKLPDPTGDGSFAAYKDMILAAAKMVGIDPTLLASMIAIESGFRTNVKAPTSSATGLGQFIKSTWDSMLQKHGSKYGIPPGTSPKNPKANVLMTAEFIKENGEYLKKNTQKKNLQPVDLYMAHFLGPAGYAKFLNAGPNATGAAINPSAASANPTIFYGEGRARTTSEIVRHFEKKLSANARKFGVDLAFTPSSETVTVESEMVNPEGVTASTVTEVTNAEAKATALPSMPNDSGNLSLDSLGSSYANVGGSKPVSEPSVRLSSMGPASIQDAPSAAEAFSMTTSTSRAEAIEQAQSLALQQTAQNDPGSKWLASSVDLLGKQLDIQTSMRDTLLKLGDVVADISTSLKEKATTTTASPSPAKTRDIPRARENFPRPAVSMARGI